LSKTSASNLAKAVSVVSPETPAFITLLKFNSLATREGKSSPSPAPTPAVKLLPKKIIGPSFFVFSRPFSHLWPQLPDSLLQPIDCAITSNTIDKNGCSGSSFIKININKLVVIMDMKVSAIVLTTICELIFLEKTSTSFFPLRVDAIDKINIAKVVVLIPPPVDPGDAPTNIYMAMR